MLYASISISISYTISITISISMSYASFPNSHDWIQQINTIL